MKYINMLLVTVLMAISQSSFAASTLQWNSIDGQTINSDLGGALSSSSSYMLMLIRADQLNPTLIGFNSATQDPGVNETLLWYGSFSSMTAGDGAFYADLQDPAPIGALGLGTLNNGNYCYTVIINSATRGPATMYSVLDGVQPSSVFVAGNGAGVYELPGGNTWIPAVPEPSTVGLFLVGMGMVALRRFRRA